MGILKDMIELIREWSARAIAILALVIVIAVTLTIFGAFPWMFSGFERAADFAQVTTDLKTQIAGSLADSSRHWALDASDEILSLKEKECALPADAPKDVYARTIVNLSVEYERLTGQPYNIPACQDL